MAAGLSDASVLYDETEQKWKMWFNAGIGGSNVPAVGIMYAESADGLAWTIQPGFALAPSSDAQAWDFTHAETPAVLKDPAAPPELRYRMWYAGGNTSQGTIGSGFPLYALGLAFSPDGKVFTRLPASDSPYGQAGLVLKAHEMFAANPQATDGVLADPEVIRKDGFFHLWCSSIATAGQTPVMAGISYATSLDGIHWAPNDENPLPSLLRYVGTELSFSAQPSVVWNEDKGVFEMWYTSDTDREREERFPTPELRAFGALGYWYAVSANGRDWTTSYDRDRDFLWDGSCPFEDHGLITGVEVVRKGGDYVMYYPALGSREIPAGWSQPFVWAMNRARRANRPPDLQILDPDVYPIQSDATYGDGWMNLSDLYAVAGTFGMSDQRYDLDGNGFVTQADIFLVAGAFGLSWPPANLKEGQLLRFYIKGTDLDGDVLLYSATGLPAGSSFNPATREFRWTPGSSQAGNYSLTFTVNDRTDSASQTLPITVLNTQ